MTTASLGRRGPLRSIAAGVLLASLLGVGISACDPEAPPPSPPTSAVPGATTTPSSSPTPSPTPSPTSEQEREKVAIKQAVLDYIAVYNEIRTDPTTDVAQLKKVAGGQLLEIELGFIREWRAKGWRATKGVTLENVEVGSITDGNDARTVTVSYCANSTGADVVDEDGNSVIRSDRQDLFPTQMELVKPQGAAWLPVERYEGGDACADE